MEHPTGHGIRLRGGERRQLSVVVPLRDEVENVLPLVEAVRTALREWPAWELLLVDDGSTDGTRDAVAAAARDPRVKLLALARNYGQSVAIQAGFDYASGEILVTMDGDLQNDPEDIPRLVAELDRGYDLVVGRRVRRKDPLLTRRLPSQVANAIIRRITGLPLHDIGCSLKAYRRELVVRIRLYSEMHRFVPILAASLAGARIAEIDVRHHPRLLGRSKYGLTRIYQVVADLLSLRLIHTFGVRPLAMFAVSAGVAGAVAVALAIAALVKNVTTPPGAESSLVLVSVALASAGLAAYLLLLGLVGEVALREQRTRGAGPPLLSWQRRGR